MEWKQQFTQLYQKCIQRYQSTASQDWDSYYDDDELKFINSLGCQPRELFDYVEDFVDEGAPSQEIPLAIAEIRKRYFQENQNSQASKKRILPQELPGFGEKLEGIAYLPRIMKKAEGKLKGELDPDIMFGCGGDRHFLRKNGEIQESEFLLKIWENLDDLSVIPQWIKSLRNQ